MTKPEKETEKDINNETEQNNTAAPINQTPRNMDTMNPMMMNQMNPMMMGQMPYMPVFVVEWFLQLILGYGPINFQYCEDPIKELNQCTLAIIRQEIEMFEVYSGCETQNRYQVFIQSPMGIKYAF